MMTTACWLRATPNTFCRVSRALRSYCLRTCNGLLPLCCPRAAPATYLPHAPSA